MDYPTAGDSNVQLSIDSLIQSTVETAGRDPPPPEDEEQMNGSVCMLLYG